MKCPSGKNEIPGAIVKMCENSRGFESGHPDGESSRTAKMFGKHLKNTEKCRKRGQHRCINDVVLLCLL